jgi:hypothetical protein
MSAVAATQTHSGALAKAHTSAACARACAKARAWKRLNDTLDEARNVNSMIRMSIEVIYGHAWKIPLKKTAEGHGIARLESIKRKVRRVANFKRQRAVDPVTASGATLSAAIQDDCLTKQRSLFIQLSGLLRCFAPRNDVSGARSVVAAVHGTLRFPCPQLDSNSVLYGNILTHRVGVRGHGATAHVDSLIYVQSRFLWAY